MVFTVTELGKLIDDASRANHGRSMQEAADLATSRGAPISKSTISETAREVKSVTPLVIRGIAAGYDVPEEDVARAILADLGFAIEDFKLSPESAIRRDPDLSAQSRAILLAAIDAARRPVPRGAIAIADELQEGSDDHTGTWFAAAKEAGVLGNQDGEDRHQRRG